MMRRMHLLTILLLMIAPLLTACWDQRLLRDHSLILSIGYDKAEEEGILKTVSFPATISGGSPGQETSNKESEVLSMTGDTVKDAEKHMDQRIPEKFDRSKTKVIIFGEELAREGLFSTLDSVYRDLRGPLNANIAIFAGVAKDAISVTSHKALLTSDLYDQLLKSAEEAGIIKTENVQTASPILLTEGQDIVLPYLRFFTEEEIGVDGVALFDRDRMTGTLNTKEASVFLILSDQTTKNTELNLKVTDDKEDENKNFVNIEISHNKRKLAIDVQGEHVQANIDLRLKVEVDEFASDHLQDKSVITQLEKDIERVLHELAVETIGKMQEANNDSLGIGEKLRAFHPATWKKIDWHQVYPEIAIEPTFDVTIIRHGIIN